MAPIDRLLQRDTVAADSERRVAGSSRPATASNTSSLRLLRSVAAIWLCYILLLAVADHYFVLVDAAKSALPASYYISQLLIALSVLALSFSTWASLRLGRAFLPVVVTTTSSLSLATTVLTVPSSLPGPLTGAVGLVELRTLPIFTVAVVLIAWQYQRRHVLLFSLGTAALIVLLHLHQPSQLLGTAARALAQGMGLLILGYCVSSMIDRLRAQRASLEKANLQLRHYASTLEQLAISRERNRVARELHDTLAHTLSGLTVQLETTKAYWQVDQQAAGTMVAAALETARSGLRETRRVLKALRASPLDELGLRLALCDLAEQASAGAHVQLECRVAQELPVLAPDVEQCVYRIAQEAIANVVQHANANTLQVHLSCGQRLQLVVRDNGRGFVHQATNDEHFGLAGMYERAALAGGDLSITSAPGKGTTVSLQI